MNKKKKNISSDLFKIQKKEQFFKVFKESIEEINLAKQGKIKLKSAEHLLNEL